MRTSLRRSCNACAKAKHSCDLGTPKCSRCLKRKVTCIYANVPLSSSSTTSSSTPEQPARSRSIEKYEVKTHSLKSRDLDSASQDSMELFAPAGNSFDPFDSYPATRLPRVHVQRLIQHFLSNISFQYYPLDLNMSSNPFIVSWWPLALADPALFHVSIQTASLDEERRAQKGFPISELLMVDSVSLIRKKIGSSLLAIQDETLNSVVTLAAIEHGKGNIEASRAHIDGAKRIVGIRGGLDQVKQVSPLTARMIAWVSLLVTGSPQYAIQDDLGIGDGVGPTLQWLLASSFLEIQDPVVDTLHLDRDIADILTRLRGIFHQPNALSLLGTELHDLTCFVVHKLLLIPPLTDSPQSECLRCAMTLYMLIIHGTTYYTHTELANSIIQRLKSQLQPLAGKTGNVFLGSLQIWVLSVTIVSATDPTDIQWLIYAAKIAANAMSLQSWDDVVVHLQNILWLETERADVFRQQWEAILT
ncbi:hypothetical protein FOCG_13178 [Fusarium oxysporum f. sp. radicis-lycopersici 26381]|nr:hypothetical protein FOWG_11298 [Fusarium oxysporum f. sp. lycopersici MN25]EXL45821.1 hypothetical protein FOCG_13178 [Fusarium oxysporum f. sp. radicis-lycopersici 26381]KAJ4279432.1 hypothetical protein NW764_006801 [Fusarium oxysporum]